MTGSPLDILQLIEQAPTRADMEALLLAGHHAGRPTRELRRAFLNWRIRQTYRPRALASLRGA